MATKAEETVPVPPTINPYYAEGEVKTHELPVCSPQRIMAELRDFFTMLRMTPGDWGSLTQLYFDNLSTLLGALFAVQGINNFSKLDFNIDIIDDINEVVWGKICPGVGFTLGWGNLYYSWMAIRLTKKYGRPYTAQPYGLNTPQAFAFVFNVMYPIYFSLSGSIGPSAAFITAYRVALVANFITGMISTVLAFFGPQILKYVPTSALLVPIAGIGIAFLGLEQLTNSLAAPIVGYYATIWLFLGWYSGVRIGYGDFRLPEALQVILAGTILGWATGLNKGETIEAASKLVKWWGPYFAGKDLVSDFDLIKDYLGIVIPIAISATATTLMCLVSAKNAGDPYPVRETLISDGIGTMLSSVFGSPFGTVIYLGHPAHKRSGALVGYSVVNGLCYVILSWFGILALIQSLVNVATIGPIVLFVGLMCNEDAINYMPPRHYAAYIVGIFPSIYDWVVNVGARSPLQDFTKGGANSNLTGNDQWYGVLAWKRGSLLISFVWVAMLVSIIDRQWKKGTFWAGVGGIFSLFGIIHVPEAGFKTFNEPLWEQCSSVPDACWEYANQWMFVVAYVMLAATFMLIDISRSTGFDSALLPAIIDKQDEEFNDWFRDAAIIIPSRGKFFLDEDESKTTTATTPAYPAPKTLDDGPEKSYDDDEIVA